MEAFKKFATHNLTKAVVVIFAVLIFWGSLFPFMFNMNFALANWTALALVPVWLYSVYKYVTWRN